MSKDNDHLKYLAFNTFNPFRMDKEQMINNPDTPIPQSDVITQVSLPYYLYSGGKLKKVERRKPEEWQFGSSSMCSTSDYDVAMNKWESYLRDLPEIEVSPDFAKKCKEGGKYYEGVDFELDIDYREEIDKDVDVAIPLPVESEHPLEYHGISYNGGKVESEEGQEDFKLLEEYD